jgi:hypothetical protein
MGAASIPVSIDGVPYHVHVPGSLVWVDDVFVSRRLVSPELYHSRAGAKLHALVLREALDEVQAGLAAVGAVPLQDLPAVEWLDPVVEEWLGDSGRSFVALRSRCYEAVVSMPCRVPRVVGADEPGTRIVHEGLADVLRWRGWPVIQDAEADLAAGRG